MHIMGRIIWTSQVAMKRANLHGKYGIYTKSVPTLRGAQLSGSKEHLQYFHIVRFVKLSRFLIPRCLWKRTKEIGMYKPTVERANEPTSQPTIVRTRHSFLFQAWWRIIIGRWFKMVGWRMRLFLVVDEIFYSGLPGKPLYVRWTKEMS